LKSGSLIFFVPVVTWPMAPVSREEKIPLKRFFLILDHKILKKEKRGPNKYAISKTALLRS
jgi:hypothetical protein